MVPNHNPAGRPPAPPPAPGQPIPTLYWIFKESWIDARSPSGPFVTPDDELPGLSSNFGAVRLASPTAQAQCGGAGSTCNMFLNTLDAVLLSGITLGVAGVPCNPTRFYVKDTDLSVTATMLAEGSAPVTASIDSSGAPVEFQAGLRINMDTPEALVTIEVIDTISSGFVLNGVVLVSAGSFRTTTVASTTANIPLVLLTGFNSTATLDIAASSSWVGGGLDGRDTTTFFVNQDSTSGVDLGKISCVAGATINLDGAANTWDLSSSSIGRACTLNLLSNGWTATLDSALSGDVKGFCESGTCTFTMTNTASITSTATLSGQPRAGVGIANYVYQFPTVVGDPMVFKGRMNVLTGTDVSITNGPVRVTSPGDIFVNVNPTTSLTVGSSLELTSDTGLYLFYETSAQFNTPSVTFSPGATLNIDGFLQLDVSNVAEEINYGDTVTVLTHEAGAVTGRFLQVKIRGWDKERAGNVSFVDYQNDKIVFTFTEIYFPPECDNPIVQAQNPACRPPVAPPINETGSITVGQVVKKSEGLSTGEILGIILAILLLILIIIALIVGFVLIKKRNRLRDGVDKGDAEMDEPDFDDPDDRF